MKKDEKAPLNIPSLTEAHRAMGLSAPKHPLISLINNNTTEVDYCAPPGGHVLNFYKISYRNRLSGRIKYGQSYYDFDEGGLLFAAPGQVIGNNDDIGVSRCALFTMLIHPDFLWNYPLAKKIKQYGFFSYSTNEGLHLSDQEKETILSVFRMIEEELNNRLDDLSHDVIVSQIELLLSYSERFYKRQFITRKPASNDLLQDLEAVLDSYFNSQTSLSRGLPSVHYLAEQLNLSPSYLSDMLRSSTGLNAQQHIHQKLIDKAKEKLSTTALSVSEVAYELGFEHPQSFSKLFKTKTDMSPLEFRRSFN